MKTRNRNLLWAAIPLLAIPLMVLATPNSGRSKYENQPHGNQTDAGYSGAPGTDQNCAACHSSGNGGGKVTVVFPNGQFYTPGQAQTWTVVVQDASKSYWGFQLSARLASDDTQQAGYFTPGGEGFTEVVCAGLKSGVPDTTKETFYFGAPFPAPCPSTLPLEWIQQTSSSLFAQPRSGQFTFTWTPPASNVGAINVYVAAVASDGTLENVYINQYSLTVPVATQPTITEGGVVNGASFAPQVSPGSFVTIQGTNLANSNRQWAASDFNGNNLPTSLDGVTVTINSVPAYIEYVSPTQVNVLAPTSLVAGTNYTVQLVNNGLTSYPGTVSMQSYAPAFFLWNGKYAVATRPDGTYVGPAGLFPNNPTTPAKPGETIVLWASGLGVTAPSVPTGQLTPRFGPVAYVVHLPTVTIGGVGATVLAAALSPGFAGLYQINIEVPQGLPGGDQPITINTGQYSSAPPGGSFLTIQN